MLRLGTRAPDGAPTTRPGRLPHGRTQRPDQGLVVAGRRQDQHDVHPRTTPVRHLDRLTLAMELADELLRPARTGLDLEQDEVGAGRQASVHGSASVSRDRRLEGGPPPAMPHLKEPPDDPGVGGVEDHWHALRVEGDPEVRPQHGARGARIAFETVVSPRSIRANTDRSTPIDRAIVAWVTRILSLSSRKSSPNLDATRRSCRAPSWVASRLIAMAGLCAAGWECGGRGVWPAGAHHTTCRSPADCQSLTAGVFVEPQTSRIETPAGRSTHG